MKIGILGIGSYLPERILTNKEMESIVDTTDEWITSRTGIRERRIAADDEATSDLSYKAALKAIEDAGIDKDEIELVIVATTTPDYSMPSTAAIVQDKIGIRKAAAFDMEAACTGFVYALTTGYKSTCNWSRCFFKNIGLGRQRYLHLIRRRGRSSSTR